MNPVLLGALLRLAQQQQTQKTMPPAKRQSPYVPPLTDYLGDYYSAIDQNAQIGGTTGQDAIGEPPANDSEVRRITGEPYISSDFMDAHGTWMGRGYTPPGIAWSDPRSTSGSVFPGAQGPIHFEDGSTAPGEISPEMALQLVAGPFQQFRTNGQEPGTSYLHQAMPVLAQALALAQSDPGRQRGMVSAPGRWWVQPTTAPYIQRTSDWPDITGAAGPNPQMHTSAIPAGALPRHQTTPAPSTLGLFGSPPPANTNPLMNRLANARKLF